MRPISLEFTAFGSYPGTHTIDFERLHELGIFVVTGPTGTGKSTIFDAMVFALYGKLPGDRPEGQVRSHHVPETTKCVVIFEFEANGDRYRVTRSPGYLRAKKRGEGFTAEKGDCSIERLGPGGWEGLASKVDQVDSICGDALGLTADQFERVVLLPQGKFQQFLLSETKERRPLLQALFGTHVYERAAAQLRSEAGAAKTKVELAGAAIAQQLKNANENLVDLETMLRGFDGASAIERDGEAVNSESLRDSLGLLGPRLEALGARAERSRIDAEAAQAAAERVKSVVDQWRKRQALRTRRDALLASAESIDADRLVVEASRRHRPVAEAATAVTRAEQLLDEAVRARTDAHERLSEVLGRLGTDIAVDGSDSLIEITAALTSARSDHAKDLEAIGRLAEVRRELDEAELLHMSVGRECQSADARLVEIDALIDDLEARRTELLPRAERRQELAQSVSELADKLAWRRELDEVDRRIVMAKQEVTDAELEHSRVWNGFVAGNAPRLARDLQDGEPCPVCGSAEHPEPAVNSDAEIVEFADVERARAEVERLTSLVGGHETERVLLVDRLGADAQIDQSELESRHAAATLAMSEAVEAAAELGILEETRDGTIQEKSRLLDGAVDRAKRLAEARGSLESLQSELGRLTGSVGDLDPSAVAARTPLFDTAKRGVEELGEADRLARGIEGSLTTERTRLEECRNAAAVVDLAAAIAMVLELDDETERGQRVEEHDDDWQRIIAGLDTFADVELPEECPDASTEVARANELSEQAQAIGGLWARARQRSGDVVSDLDAVESMTAENSEDLVRYELLDRVASRCEGKGQSRISLETWVLAGELDRVIAAANVHLQRMTSARYRLERTDEAGHGGRQAGLDLAVRDSHTGRTRPPASLSGGEQFQTSLSLALGLADVVSHGGVASGRRFEALFVDEGFGSLDPDALENAMTALEEIQKAGRMVGVITHVEAMKDVLPIGIRVERLPGDRGSTLVVRPND